MFSSLASMPNVTTNFTDGVMINADCLHVLKKLTDKSVSVIIIDPPYGAQTHNQNVWDVAWSSTFWQDIVKECFRVLAKGGHMVVFAGGKTIFDIHMNIASGYKTIFKESTSFYRMIWKHNSLDSSRVHSHTPRSQFEDILVYFRTGEGKAMFDEGMLKKRYALDPHTGRTNVLEFYKDDCRSKAQQTVKKFFENDPNKWTFDYKPEALMRALVRDFTSPGHTVVDFCMRHGMSVVAAKLEFRKFIGVEVDADAYKRAVSRYSELFSECPVQITSTTVPVAYSVSAPIIPDVTTDSDSEERFLATDLTPAIPEIDSLVSTVPFESLPTVPFESLPTVPLESLPTVPPESLPTVPSESLPTVPLESLPTVSLELPSVPPESLPTVPSELLPTVPSESLPVPATPPGAERFWMYGRNEKTNAPKLGMHVCEQKLNEKGTHVWFKSKDGELFEVLIASKRKTSYMTVKSSVQSFTRAKKRKARGNEPDELSPKRQDNCHLIKLMKTILDVSLEGKIIEIGTQKRFTKILVFKKMISIDGDKYLVAYPDNTNELKAMTIWKKDVQRCIGDISIDDMALLRNASMPSRI